MDFRYQPLIGGVNDGCIDYRPAPVCFVFSAGWVTATKLSPLAIRTAIPCPSAFFTSRIMSIVTALGAEYQTNGHAKLPNRKVSGNSDMVGRIGNQYTQYAVAGRKPYYVLVSTPAIRFKYEKEERKYY